MKKLIYIIGPYRSTTIRGVVENIRRAEEAAIRLWKLGAAPICPHMNSALMDGIVPDEEFLAGGIEIMKRCDAVYLCEGWRESRGSLKEFSCVSDNQAVFTAWETSEAWIKGFINGENT